MGDFGLIQRDNHNENANSQTCNRSATVKVPEVLGGRLQSAAEAEDQRAQDDGPTAAKAASREACHSSTKEGASSKDGHDSTAS
jgi:hypothetical protein